MSTVEETASGQYLARLGILTTVCLWALQFPLLHELAENWDPYSITALRYATSTSGGSYGCPTETAKLHH